MATKRTMSARNKKLMATSGATLGGFTIIEVVLVLAIAGLIFLMVFIALPQLQAAQRNTQRREDMSKLDSAIVHYQANNNGKIPNQSLGGTNPISGDSFVSRYIVGEFVDPNGEPYNVVFVNAVDQANQSVETENNMVVVNNAYCENEAAVHNNHTRDYAILYKLEGSGVYCIDNGGAPAPAANNPAPAEGGDGS